VAHALQLYPRETHPAEVAQGPPLGVLPVPGNGGCIEVSGAATVAQEADALTLAAPQAMVHVAEDYQRQWALVLQTGDGQGQILIPPVAGGALPVAPARITGLPAEPRGAAVGQQHQWQGWIRRRKGTTDARGRFLQVHRSEHGGGGLRQVVAAAGRRRSPTHNSQAGRTQGAKPPTAVQLSKPIQLAAQAGATGVAAGIVVAEHTGHRQRHLAQQSRNAATPIAEVPHQQQGIGPQLREQGMVAVVPLIVEISGDGDLQLGLRRLLPRLTPS